MNQQELAQVYGRRLRRPASRPGKVTIRYESIVRRNPMGALVVKERTFASETAMQKWVARQESLAEAERGGFVGVVAYSYGGGSDVGE